MKFRFVYILSLVILSACAGYHPVYKKDNTNIVYELQGLGIVTDDKKTSNNIKKYLLQRLPIRKKVDYILKIETKTTTSGTVSNIDTKVSGYEIQTELFANLYKRERSDILIQEFKEKKISPYNLSSNEVLSTLASREKAESLAVKHLSKAIYDRLIIYFIKSQTNAN